MKLAEFVLQRVELSGSQFGDVTYADLLELERVGGAIAESARAKLRAARDADSGPAAAPAATGAQLGTAADLRHASAVRAQVTLVAAAIAELARLRATGARTALDTRAPARDQLYKQGGRGSPQLRPHDALRSRSIELLFPNGASEPATAPARVDGGSSPLAAPPAEDAEDDADAEPLVRFGVLVEHFWLHLLPPFSVAYVWPRYGWSAVVNMQLLWFTPPLRDLKRPLRYVEYLAVRATPVIFPVVVALYACRWRALEADGITIGELLMPMTMLVAHRFMVALKYATLSRAELRAFLAAPEEVAARHTARIQLMSGTRSPDPEMVFVLIGRAWRLVHNLGNHPLSAHAPLEQRASEHAFAVEPEAATRWRALLEPLGPRSPFAAVDDPATVSSVHVADLLCAIVLRSSGAARNASPLLRFGGAFVRLLSVLTAALPFVLRAIRGERPFGNDAAAAVVVCSCFLLTMAWWRINSLFLIGIERWYAAIALQREMLSSLITGHDGVATHSCAAHLQRWPTIDLTTPAAVRAFALLVKLQFAYGRTYTVRMGWYQTLVIAAVAANGLLLTLALRSAQGIDGRARGELSADERRALVLSLPVCECVLLVVTVGLLFFAQLRSGSHANEQVGTLRVHVLAAISAAHTRLECLANGPPQRAAGASATAALRSERLLVQQAIALLQHELATIDEVAQLMPVELLGVTASMSLAYTVGWSLLTAGVVLLDKVYGVRLVPSFAAASLGVGGSDA